MKTKFKGNWKKNIIGGVIILAFSLIIMLALFYYSEIQLEATAIRELEESASDKQAEINAEFTTIENYILSTSNALLYDIDNDTDEITSFLATQNKLFGFNELYYVDNEMMGYSDKGQVVDLSNLSFNSQAKHGDVTITYNSTGGSIVQETLALQTPIVNDGETRGYLYAIYSLQKIADSLEQEIANIGYALFTTSEAFDFFSTDITFLPFDENSVAVFEHESVTISNIMQDLESQHHGNVSFELNGITMVSVYKPLNINGWSLVMSVDRDLYIADIRTLSTVLTIFVLGMFFVGSIFILYVWNAKNAIEKVAYYDELTGLSNLAKFKNDMLTTLKKQPDSFFVIVKMDIHNFKAINELYDFSAGDKVLCAFASIESVAQKREKTFLLARTGADEFMMFAGNNFLAKLPQMTATYEKLLKRSIPEIKQHRLEFKYGRYFIEPGDTNVDEIIAKAGMAHQVAKAKEGNFVWDYDNRYKENILKRATITNKMDEALATGEFSPYLQPKIDLHTNKISGAEALVRWIKPDGTLVFPGDFISIFESNGFIVKLDMFMLDYVCKTLKEWQSYGFACVPIAVNFSRLHFKSPDFVKDVTAIVDSYGISREYIEIELTENIIFENEDVVVRLVDDIQREGFKVSIDDFGSGYSSLGMLKNLKVNTLKLDRSFFINERDSVAAEKVIAGIISLAHNIDMTIVAEGVETIEQIAFLKKMDCDIAQGYYYSKPITLEDFSKNYLKPKNK